MAYSKHQTPIQVYTRSRILREMADWLDEQASMECSDNSDFHASHIVDLMQRYAEQMKALRELQRRIHRG